MRKRWKENELKNSIPLAKSVVELANILGVSVKSIYSRAHIESISLLSCYKPKTRDRKEISKDWYNKNKQKANSFAKEWRKSKRQELISLFGGKCILCGIDNPILLDFDHINNDGWKDSKKNIIFHVQENPERFQLLCKNCNWLKEYHRRSNAK